MHKLLRAKFAIVLLTLVISSITSLSAKVILPSIFTDNMVLQQKASPLIWGKAEAGEKVTVKSSWDNREYQTTADQAGDWKVKVNTPVYGGPYSIVISDGELTELQNVLIGEVWLCSGQSNMEMPLAGWGKVLNYEKEISEANYPQIRLFQAKKTVSNVPQFSVEADGQGWAECAPESVANFSSVAYFFAREIHQKTNIPIGLIHSSWGGTVAQAWVSGSSLKTMTDFRDAVAAIEQSPQTANPKQEPNVPTVLYNAMINPFVNFTIKGAIWYQGESNASKAKQYETLFPLLITDWRRQGKSGDFPFYFVQLAGFMDKEVEPPLSSDWADLRQAQTNTLKLPNTGMAVAIDIGDKKDIHPKNKQEVGRRLALIALHHDYGQNKEYSGPVMKSVKPKGNSILVSFKHAEGLHTKGSGPVRGFAVAGPDGKYYWADAEIKGNVVSLSSNQVSAPKSVSYGWENYPDCNLYNAAGLPAIPFRLD